MTFSFFKISRKQNEKKKEENTFCFKSLIEKKKNNKFLAIISTRNTFLLPINEK